jgi:hypothetical protein
MRIDVATSDDEEARRLPVPPSFENLSSLSEPSSGTSRDGRLIQTKGRCFNNTQSQPKCMIYVPLDTIPSTRLHWRSAVAVRYCHTVRGM